MKHMRDIHHYGKANFDTLREYFRNINCCDLGAADNVYKNIVCVFKCMMRELVGMSKYLKSCKKGKAYFNSRCEKALQRRNNA